MEKSLKFFLIEYIFNVVGNGPNDVIETSSAIYSVN